MLSVLPPLFVGRMVDGLTRRDFPNVLHQLELYVLVTAGFGLIQLAQSFSSSVFRESLARKLRLSMVRKLDRASYEAVVVRTPGELNNRITSDIDSLCTQVQYTLFPTLSAVCTLVATIVAMAREEWRLAAVAVVFAFFTVLPLRLAAARLAAMHKRQSEAADDLHGYMQEGATAGGLALLRNASAARQRFERFGGIVSRIYGLGIAQTLLGESSGLASSLVSMAGPAAIMGIGAYLVARGEMTTGTIVTMLIYQSRMSVPFNTLSSMQLLFATLKVVSERLLDVFDLPEEPAGGLPFVPGTIALSGVGFSRGERAILRDASLSVAEGEHVAVIGPSGAGKSTLATLLQRLYACHEGSIAIAGVPLEAIELASLRESVALVFQEPLVFDAPMRENLTLTNPAAGDEEIAEVLDICGLAGVVAALPDGLETRMGQRGMRLSGGERQRLCLARAVLQRPHVLILDEALSGVDVGMEAAILERLRERLRGRTLLAITHRVASVEGFDRIVAVEDGRFVERAACAAS